VTSRRSTSVAGGAHAIPATAGTRVPSRCDQAAGTLHVDDFEVVRPKNAVGAAVALTSGPSYSDGAEWHGGVARSRPHSPCHTLVTTKYPRTAIRGNRLLSTPGGSAARRAGRHVGNGEGGTNSRHALMLASRHLAANPTQKARRSSSVTDEEARRAPAAPTGARGFGMGRKQVKRQARRGTMAEVERITAADVHNSTCS